MKAIVNVATNHGFQTAKGEKFGDYLAVIPNGTKWSVTHLPSGYGVAYFAKKKEADCVAKILELSKADWNWKDAGSMPSDTKRIVHEIFVKLKDFIKFVPQ